MWEVIIYSTGKDRFYSFPFLFLFRLLTPLYQALSRMNLRRRQKRQSREWNARLISIGNITVGGAGKSPLVIALAKACLAGGNKPLIIHSGYGRRAKNDVILAPDDNRVLTPEQVGDEVAMMRPYLPRAAFAVGRNKKNMAIKGDSELAPDIILIDDGYQRLDIEKDVDLLVLPFELIQMLQVRKNKICRLFPSGILREAPRAIARADAIAVTTHEENINRAIIDRFIRQYNERAPIHIWRMAFDGITQNGAELSLEALADRKPFLFAGIGSFRRLKDMVEQAGIETCGHYDIGDHCEYDKSDIELLRSISNDAGADCYLTTAKDVVKLPDTIMDKPVYCLHLRATPDDAGVINELTGCGQA